MKVLKSCVTFLLCLLSFSIFSSEFPNPHDNNKFDSCEYAAFCSIDLSEISAGIGFQYAFGGIKKTMPTDNVDLYISLGGGIAVGLESKELFDTKMTVGVNALVTPFFYVATTTHVKYHFGENINQSWAVALELGQSASGASPIKSNVMFLSVSHPISW